MANQIAASPEEHFGVRIYSKRFTCVPLDDSQSQSSQILPSRQVTLDETTFVVDKGALEMLPAESAGEIDSTSSIKAICEKIHAKDRKAFVYKVLKLLLCQFTILIAAQAITITIPHARRTINRQPLVAIMSGLASLLTLCLAACCKTIAKRFPNNVIVMSSFVSLIQTLFSTHFVVFVSTCYPPLIVLYASLATFCLVTALTIYACVTKSDFTMKISLFLSLSVTAIFFALFAAAIRTSYVELVKPSQILMSIVVVCFGLYLIYDVQSLAGGRYESISIDNYVLATMMLYIVGSIQDIVVLFLALLKCFGSLLKS